MFDSLESFFFRMTPLLTSIPPDSKQKMKPTVERESPEDAFTLALKVVGSYADTLPVRTINLKENRLRQDGISTKCGCYPAVRLVDRQ